MTDYEILSLVATVIGLLIGVLTLLLKLFAYLDYRYKRKRKPHPRLTLRGEV